MHTIIITAPDALVLGLLVGLTVGLLVGGAGVFLWLARGAIEAEDEERRRRPPRR